MAPCVLADITLDGTVDIIIATFNSTVIAFDGSTYDHIWTYYTPTHAETYSTPAPGYYNSDDILDFMIQYSSGPGFPIYYTAHTLILDGKDGVPFSTEDMQLMSSLVGVQSSPLTISRDVRGTDMFIYWAADCHTNTNTTTHTQAQPQHYQFITGTNVHEESRSDQCRLRFDTAGYSRLYLTSTHHTRPTIIYDSDTYSVSEREGAVNTTREGLDFISAHPKYVDVYTQFVDATTKRTDGGQRGQSGGHKKHVGRPRRRRRRHVGTHDNEGIQRLISTGTLAAPLPAAAESAGPSGFSSMDVIFSTYWFYPAHTQALLEEDTRCIERRINTMEARERFDEDSMYYGLDHDAYVTAVSEECLELSGHYLTKSARTYETQTDYNPFDVHMGQMTVYRMRVTCTCGSGGGGTRSDSSHSGSESQSESECSHMLPYESQGWPGYMGLRGDSLYNTHRDHSI